MSDNFGKTPTVLAEEGEISRPPAAADRKYGLEETFGSTAKKLTLAEEAGDKATSGFPVERESNFHKKTSIVSPRRWDLLTPAFPLVAD